MLGTTPFATNSRPSSTQSHCDRLAPILSGLSHASLTRCIATSGGEKRLASTAALVGEAGDSEFLEPVEPLVDDTTLIIDDQRNVRDRKSPRPQQDHLAATSKSCSDQHAPLPTFEFLLFVDAEQDDQRRCSATRHGLVLSTRGGPPDPPLGGDSHRIGQKIAHGVLLVYLIALGCTEGAVIDSSRPFRSQV